MDNQQVLDLFIGRGMVDTALAQDIIAEIENSGKEVGEILADYQVISSRDDVWQLIAQELGTQYIDLTDFEPPEALLSLVPAGMARLHGALPVAYDSDGISVCLTDPLNPQILEDLRFAIGQEVKLMVAPDYLVEQKINDLYGGQEKAMDDILSQLDGGLNFDGSEGSMEEEANSAPIMRYVDLVLFQAIREKASDIHFEPFENEFKIRYRVDGSLYEMAPPPKHLALPIISRVKVMSNMNIAERRVPQDGRIVKQIGEQHIDMRVSSLPTQYGESVVLRVLDR
ncbi:ATPase, T2SS/T4P/T4SS family, partial [Akkermansiaceae bacterium]|nr:ATPase, T2SS/T4P/T4SS family [Akkermansiaceae bacterium]